MTRQHRRDLLDAALVFGLIALMFAACLAVALLEAPMPDPHWEPGR